MIRVIRGQQSWRTRFCTPEELMEYRLMDEDPIVAEVRRIREERASRFDYDVHKIFADLMTRKDAEDRTRPSVEDANKWAQAVAAEDALTVQEEPPREA